MLVKDLSPTIRASQSSQIIYLVIKMVGVAGLEPARC